MGPRGPQGPWGGGAPQGPWGPEGHGAPRAMGLFGLFGGAGLGFDIAKGCKLRRIIRMKTMELHGQACKGSDHLKPNPIPENAVFVVEKASF